MIYARLLSATKALIPTHWRFGGSWVPAAKRPIEPVASLPALEKYPRGYGGFALAAARAVETFVSRPLADMLAGMYGMDTIKKPDIKDAAPIDRILKSDCPPLPRPYPIPGMVKYTCICRRKGGKNGEWK
jgi:hypothetical protein